MTPTETAPVALAPVALAFDPSTEPTPGGPPGPGRSAGVEFLDAYLSHGSFDSLVALVRTPPAARLVVKLCQDHPSSRSRRRRLQVVTESEFHTRFLTAPPSRVVQLAHLPDDRLAWARQSAGDLPVALTGMAASLSSAQAVTQLGRLVTAPFEPCDALVCASDALARLVRTVTEACADDLRERHGGQPRSRVRLETIPPGVDPVRFRPADAPERLAARAALGVAPDEVAVLHLGALSPHAAAQPFPLYQAVARAARQTGLRVHLILCGWAAQPAVRQAFTDGARVFAPGVRVSCPDGNDGAVRASAWRAADVFAHLADCVQDTAGPAVIEAMASGLPVVASDWGGVRDLVEPGVTGLLARTWMLPGAGRSATARLISGEMTHDHFLGQVGQTVTVDVADAADALARLLADAGLRRALGEAGRARALGRFAWSVLIPRYETLWREQEAERARLVTAAAPGRAGPACYPAPEVTFAGHPTGWLADDTPVVLDELALAGLWGLLQIPLTSHGGGRRVTDAEALRGVLRAVRGAPTTLGDVVGRLSAGGADDETARATAAWLLKYGLLQRA